MLSSSSCKDCALFTLATLGCDAVHQARLTTHHYYGPATLRQAETVFSSPLGCAKSTSQCPKQMLIVMFVKSISKHRHLFMSTELRR
jgi:hypothetical protein